ncbi:uncharacterized protein LY79DRAFT_322429 [Colletotrichum navitas]|uniref:Uncharacterized protein n=1 Tax=Colletotrichum navitas TaxID=681940 RepID=A0AAD8QBG6_9PEZI|nr:uncharacterized protein LY79DRAFT_322429 [Colletotrichum navitas]KAK1597929.1 hypothetical protein LY79DRAFT_322429 [Colletotrichum navitas]
MCFWAAGLSLRTAFWPTSMDRGVDGGGGGAIREHIASGHRGMGLAPSMYFVSFLLDFFGLFFFVSREDTLLTSIARFLVRFSRPLLTMFVFCFSSFFISVIHLFSPFLAVNTRAISTSI